MAESKLIVDLILKNEKYLKDIKKSKEATGEFTGGLKKLGGIIAAAFTVKKVVQFGVEMEQLGTKVKSVTDYFNTFSNNIQLDALRKSTGGVVDNLKLMQQTNLAKNLGVDVKNLGLYFKFASVMAARTGQSVDYLTESIVTGIGRESKLIIDNLGISQKDLNDEIKKTGDFEQAVANIISQRMSEAGIDVEKMTSSTERLATSWNNFEQWLSTTGIGSFFKEIADSLSLSLDYISGNLQSNFNIQGKTLAELAVILADLQNQLSISPESNMLKERIDAVTQAMVDLQNVTKQKPKPYEFEVFKDISGESFDTITSDVDSFTDGTLTSLRTWHAEWSKQWRDAEIPLVEFQENQREYYNTMQQQTEYAMNQMSRLLISGFVDIGTALTSGGDVLNAFSNFITNIGSLMVDLGMMVASSGVALKGLESMNPYVMIASGIALSILAGLISHKKKSLSMAAGGQSFATVGSSGAINCDFGGSYDYDNRVQFDIAGDKLVGVLNNYNLKRG